MCKRAPERALACFANTANETSGKNVLVANKPQSANVTVTAIAGQIEAALGDASWHASESARLPGGELAMREAGVAVFFTELAAALRQPRFAELSASLLTAAVGRLESIPMDCGLYSGSTGIAWAVNHAVAMGITQAETSDKADLTAEYDDLLLEHVQSGKALPVDVIRGMAGMGTYALSRLPRRSAQRTLEVLCERFSATAEQVPGGRAWLGHSDAFTEATAPVDVDGFFPIGLAHGVSGTIGFLSRVVDRGYDYGARDLLESAMGALLTAVQDLSCTPASPRMMDRRGRTWGAPSFTWCWGDIGTALAAVHAGLTLQRPTWVEHGLSLARSAALGVTPTPDTSASLCHGMAGASHALDAISRMTGERTLDQYARRWRDTLLHACTRPSVTQARRNGMPAGFSNLASSIGFLIGSAGVGLALLASSNAGEPAWNALLHMDSPHSHRR